VNLEMMRILSEYYFQFCCEYPIALHMDQVHMVLYDHRQLVVQQLPLSDSAST
jgi:hypothetical protein